MIVKIDGEFEEFCLGMIVEVEIFVVNLKDVVLVLMFGVVELGVEYFCWVKDGLEME